jgi:hypothetical protein
MTRAKMEAAKKLIELKKPLIWTGTLKELARKMPRQGVITTHNKVVGV